VIAVAARLINALFARELRGEFRIVHENRIRIRAISRGDTLGGSAG
jgi:hypothetical protein